VRHPWPGNIRELRNTIEGMVVFAEGHRALDVSDLPAALREPEREGEVLRLAVGMTVEEAERRIIEATLRHTGDDKPRAAAMLGIGLRTLYRKIKEYRLSS
jgi:transcriptional regulator with PAS, ATPase and Fis domain